MDIEKIISLTSSIATTIGVFFVAWQLWLTKKQAQAQFEEGFDQQYRALSLPIPLDIFLGAKASEDNKKEVRELIFNYLDLSNEQVFLRSRGKITKSTWKIWSSGIQANLETLEFKSVYNEVSSDSRFTYLSKLVKSNFDADPRKF